MSLSDDARTAIANVTADPDDFTAGGRTIALACADEILAVVMPDGRTIAQHLDEVDRLRAENDRVREEWDIAAGLHDKVRVENAALLELVRWLHPDPAPDPNTAAALERDGLLSVLTDALKGADHSHICRHAVSVSGSGDCERCDEEPNHG